MADQGMQSASGHLGRRGKHLLETSSFQIHDLENNSEEVDGGRDGGD